MFIKVKKRGRKIYYELAHSQRKGSKVAQKSVHIGSSLNLTGQQWLDIVAKAPWLTLAKLSSAVRAFAPDAQGLQEASRWEWQRIKMSLSLSPDYALLGLSAGATAAQVKSAFRRAAAKHHPDVGGDAEHFRRLAHARDRLLKSPPTNGSATSEEGLK